MQTVNRVKIEVCGAKYVIVSTKEEAYVREMGRLLDTQVRELMDSAPGVTFNDALVLAAMNFLDAYKQAEENADHLRSQVSAYLEDAGRARIEADEAQREVRRLQEALQQRAAASGADAAGAPQGQEA